MLVEVLMIIVGFLLMNVTVMTGKGGLSSISYCIDIPTLVCILVLSLPILFRRGLWRDFFRAFRLLKRTYVCSLGDLKRSKEAVELMQKQVLYAGIVVATMGIVYVMACISEPSSLGPCIAVVVLSILYMAILELLLLPLQYEVKQRLITYMEGEGLKRRALQLLLGILYICLVAVLLLIHVQSITGDVQRVLATTETLFLAAFTALVLVLYLKTVSNKGQKSLPQESENTVPDSFEAFEGRLVQLCEGKPPEEALSPREAEVAWLLYRGYTNRQIGEELYIAETTVKKHASHIYEKLKVSGKKELKEKILSDRDKDGSTINGRK